MKRKSRLTPPRVTDGFRAGRGIAVLTAACAAAAVAACAAAPAAMAAKAPDYPRQVHSLHESYFTADVAWKKVSGAESYQIRTAKEGEPIASAEAKDAEVTKTVAGDYATWLYTPLSDLDAGSTYRVQMRAGKVVENKKKVARSTYEKLKAAGAAVETGKVKQYKAKKADGKWTGWRTTKPRGHTKLKTRKVTAYYKVSEKTAWSKWSKTCEVYTEELPAANTTKNGKRVNKLAVPSGGVTVSYVGLSKPWTGSDSSVTKLRLDASEGLWEPSDEKPIDGFWTGDYDTGEYCFKGWYLDEALTKECASAAAANAAAEDGKVTLYAKWGAHDYRETKIYRKVSTPCGWIRATMPKTTAENGYIVGGFFKTEVPIDHWREVYVGQSADEVYPVYTGGWEDVPAGTLVSKNNPLWDWSNCLSTGVGIRYDTDTCTWEAVDVSADSYMGKMWAIGGCTENMCAYWPLKYEVCPDCNHVGERITKLMNGAHITTQFTFEWTAAGVGKRMCGNVAGNRTGEDVHVVSGDWNPYKVFGTAEG